MKTVQTRFVPVLAAPAAAIAGLVITARYTVGFDDVTLSSGPTSN